MDADIKYFQIIEKHRAWKGERYFRVDKENEIVLQVCASPGENIRGKNNLIGIYQIKLNSFLSNYYFPNHSYNYVEKCSSELFYNQFEKTIRNLRK